MLISDLEEYVISELHSVIDIREVLECGIIKKAGELHEVEMNKVIDKWESSVLKRDKLIDENDRLKGVLKKMGIEVYELNQKKD